MLRRRTLAVGVAGLCVVGSTQLAAQGPTKVVARDFDCLAAALGPLVEIDFEGLPFDQGPRLRPGQEVLPNPLEIEGASFSGESLRAGFCSSPTCFRDPDNSDGGNIALFLNPGSSISLPPGTGAAILDIQGMGGSPFTLLATDKVGGSVDAAGIGVTYGRLLVVFASGVGLSRIEVTDAVGPLVLAALFLSKKLSAELPPDCDPVEDVSHLLPSESGTVGFFPEFGILENASVGSDIQSTYFRTTEENREFRRGFIEFAVPDVPDEILAAKLLLSEDGGATSYPVPPDRHELSYYDADLEVTIADFDRETTPLELFETDANLPDEVFAFDVTRVLRSFRGKNLGFRIKLAADPDFDGFGWLGSGFGSLAAVPPVLQIRTGLAIDAAAAFRRGDANEDGKQNLSDAMTILSVLFIRDAIACQKSAGVNDSGAIDISDAIWLLFHLFQGGPPPAAPFHSCGVDETEDGLTCAVFPTCP